MGRTCKNFQWKASIFILEDSSRADMHQLASSGRARESPEHIASVVLEFGRLLMESGATGRAVEESTARVASGLGAEAVSVRVGYASLTVTVSYESNEVTRMHEIGPLGVNQRLHQALSGIATGIKEREITAAELRNELNRLAHECRPHQEWFIAIAAGIACAAFGRLLDVDWNGVGPVFIGAVLAQFLRLRLSTYRFNPFLSTMVVAFVGSVMGGLAARLAGSQTVPRDMVSTVLLLVPGVPAFNAQLDVLSGRPTLGSARSVWVLTTLLFMSAGLWLAFGILGEGR